MIWHDSRRKISRVPCGRLARRIQIAITGGQPAVHRLAERLSPILGISKQLNTYCVRLESSEINCHFKMKHAIPRLNLEGSEPHPLPLRSKLPLPREQVRTQLAPLSRALG